MGTDSRDLGRTTPAGETIASFLDLDELLCRLAAYASDSAGTESSCVLLHDADAHELVVAAANGPTGNRMRGQRFPDADGVAGTVLRSRQPCVVTEGRGHINHHPLSAVDRVADAAVHFLIAAPLQVENRTLGVVEAVNRRGGRAFDPADIERFVNCCSMMAVAVENASLYRRLHTETEVSGDPARTMPAH